MLFFEVLMLALLVAQLCLFVLEFLLADEPEVVNTQPLVVVESNLVLLLLYERHKSTALHAESFLKLVVVDVINGLRTG